MEHRNLDHHSVCRRKSHTVTDTLSVVDNVVVRQHNALREACRTRGVLHIANVARLDSGCHSGNLLAADELIACHCFVKRETSVLLEADRDDVAQEGKRFGVERLAGNGVFQFGAERVDDLLIIRIKTAFDHDERMRVGLTEQIFRLVNLVCRIYGNENSTDLGGRPEGDIPSGKVCCPNGNLRTRLDAERNECSGKAIYVLAELRIGSGVIERRVFEAVLIGKLICHAVEHLGEGQIDQLILFPNVLSRAVVVKVKALFHIPRRMEMRHIVDKMRENDFVILKIVEPFWLPLQRDKGIVIDRREGAHHVFDRHRSFADQLIFAVVVRVTHMNVRDVGAEILDRLVARLAVISVRVVNVPQCRKMVAGKAVKHCAKTAGVGVNSAGFDQNTDVFLFGNGQELTQCGNYRILVVVQGTDDNVGDSRIVRNFNQIFDRRYRGFIKRNVKRGVKAGNGKSFVSELTNRSGGVVFVERTAFFHQRVKFCQIIYFNTRKAHIQGYVEHFIKGKVRPSSGGKRKFHSISSS